MRDNDNETFPLLASTDRQEARQHPLKTFFHNIKLKLSSASLVLRLAPIVLLAVLGNDLPTTTALDLMEKIICEIWYYLKDPSQIPDNDEDIPPELCSRPGPATAFSWFLSIQAINLALCSFITSSLGARFGARIGRKPVLLTILLGSCLSLVCFIAALHVNSAVAAFGLLVLWIILDALCSPGSLLLMANMMLVDTLEPSERTSSFAILHAFFSAGTVPSFTIGGMITVKAGNPVVVAIVALSITALALIIAIIIGPETFGTDKRDASRRERIQRATLARERSLERWIADEGDSTRGVRRAARKTAKGVLSVFEPLMRFKPRRNPQTGQLNLRLLIIGMAWFLAALSIGYFAPALLGYMMIVLRGDPEQNGRVLTVLSIAQVLGMSLLVPSIIKWGRPWYSKRYHASHPISDNEESLVDPQSDNTSSHFDLYLLMGSALAYVVMLCLIGLSTNRLELMIAVSFISLGSGARPALQSIAAASAAPIVSGEILAAMAMLEYIAGFAAPIMLGYLGSKLLTTEPSAIFFIMALILLASVALLPLVRDEDRYIESRDGQPPSITEPDAQLPEAQT